jgi:inosose dehydratase
MLIACAPTGWPSEVPPEQILTEITQAGYSAAAAMPREGHTALDTVRLYAQHWLFPAPGLYTDDFWRVERRTAILRETRLRARFVLDVGCNELFLSTGGYQHYVGLHGKSRSELVGRITHDDGLNSAEWRRFVDLLHQVGETAGRDGVRCCFRNQVGSVIETAEEIDKLLTRADPSLLYLGPDTGHLAWAGIDPVDFCRRHAERIQAIYLTDISPDVLRHGQSRGWDYDRFMRAGLFVTLGTGCVDFSGVLAALESAGFAGWVIVEPEPTPALSAPQSAAAAREYLDKIISALSLKPPVL